MMMNKDPTRISSVLDFLSKQLDKLEDNKNNEEEYKKIKENLGMERTEGEEKTSIVRKPDMLRPRAAPENLD